MLTITQLNKSFGARLLFNQAELVVHAGEKVGLIGANGCGKTTLFRLIEGKEEPDGGAIQRQPHTRIGILRQEMVLTGRSLLQEVLHGDEELVRLRQELEDHRLRLDHHLDGREREQLTHHWGALSHRLEEIGTYGAEARAGEILQGLGFAPNALAEPLENFSGGWRMRVALAQLLFARPDLLLLDEPTNHLDLESVAWLENYLSRAEGTMIFISHDRSFLNRVAGVIVELEGGKLTRYPGNFDHYLEQKEENWLRLEKSAALQEQRIEELDRFIRRFRAKATKAKQVQSRIKMLAKMEKVEQAVAPPPPPRFRLPMPPPCAKEVLTVERMGKKFGDTPIFNQAAFRLRQGEKIGLLGPNGTGKTTLLKLIAGWHSPDEGRLQLGERVQPAYFAQHALEALDPAENVLNSALALAPLGMGEGGVRSLLGGFLFSGESVFTKVSHLSGGEKARLALARLFLTGANLLLLDEPTNHLDMSARTALEEALENYQGTLLLVSHDRDLLEGVCQEYLIIEGGTIRRSDDSLESYLEKSASARNRDEEKKVTSPTGDDNVWRQRNQQRARLRLLRKQIASSEERIASLEHEHATLEKELANPQLYLEGQESHWRQLEQRSRGLAVSLEKLMSEWEALNGEADGLQAALD